MNKYTDIHYNVDRWYDWLNDTLVDQFFYAYLSLIEEYPDDYE